MTNSNKNENGAALIAVLFISILLVTASAFLLNAVGNNSRNTTDVLSETKAYYAAESGLQASINVLRNSNVEYSDAAASQTLAIGTIPDSSTVGLVYSTDTDGKAKVMMATNAKYSIQAYDPDADKPYTFHTSGIFTAAGNTAVKDGGRTLCAPAASCVVGAETTPRTEITFVNASANTLTFPLTANPSLGEFSVVHFGAGFQIPADIKFRLDFQLTSPRVEKRTIRAKTVATTAGSSARLDFLSGTSATYMLLGSEIKICAPQTTCPIASNIQVSSGSPVNVFANIDKRAEPYRLVVRSTGYGPNGARKILEGVLRKNYLDDLASTSAISLIGPAAGMVFDAGTGGPRYCGVDGGYEPGDSVPNTPPCTLDPNTPTGPSIGVTDPAGLPTVNAGGSGAYMNPPPDVVTDLPDWQQTPAALNDFIVGQRLESINNAGAVYIPNGGSVGTPGDHATGLGLTFCEGDCTAGPVSGGGILVVTGSFSYNGNFSFNGLIIVTGAGGMHRNGGGGGQIIGNVIIAPYNPADLNAGFLPPRFTTNGGGNSDILFGGTSSAFDGTNAVTNKMLGIAEK